MLSEGFASPDNAPPGVADIYTDLDTTRSEHVVEEADLRDYVRRSEQARRVSAQEMVDRETRRLILGDPGSGKSTLLKHMAYLLAMAALSEQPTVMLERLQPWTHGVVLPVYIELRAVATYATEHKVDASGVRLLKLYLEYLLAQWGIAESWPVLRDTLENEDVSVILLLDGLDEVGIGQRKLMAEMTNGLMADRRFGRHRCLVTCRPYAYYDVAKDLRLHHFVEVMLAPFSEEQVDRFVVNWYARLSGGSQPIFTTAQAQMRLEDLRIAMRRRDHRSIAQRPILLTMMVQLHSFRGRLPTERVQLYKESVDLLLTRWNTKSHGQPGLREFLDMPDLKDEDVEKALLLIAYRAHTDEAGFKGTSEVDDDASADISEQNLHDWVRPFLGGSDRKAALFVQYMRERAGLLVRHKTAAYTFPHRSLQEYLAACHLVRSDDVDYILDAPQLVRQDAVRWREVFVLAAGYAARYVRTGDAVACINELCPSDCPSGGSLEQVTLREWTQADVAADAVLEIGSVGVKRMATGAALWSRLQEWLLSLISRPDEPDANTRTAAGRKLAMLGDTRAALQDVHFTDFCYVPKGPFVMGDDKKQFVYDMRYDYWISRYPITVAQFDQFWKAGGYQESQFWIEAYDDGLWHNGLFRGRDKPRRFGEPFDLPNCPIMGVSWYEALAFVRWFSCVAQSSSGVTLTLPNEPEWEKAARGGLEVASEKHISSLNDIGTANKPATMAKNGLVSRRYAWGDKPNRNLANYDDTKIGSSSAVGCFSGGASPYGVEEMNGNVWEWTRSMFGDYPYPESASEVAKRESPVADRAVERVLRGGAFNSNSDFIRCASRFKSKPELEYWNSGFRIVLHQV